MKKRHLIIGAGNAGLSAAATIARLKPEDEIEIISDEPWAPYCRCLLTYYLEGKITKERLFAWGEAIIRKNRLNYHPNERVLSIDSNNLSVECESGSRKRADSILIATGSKPFKPDFPGADLPGIFTLRTFNDALAIKQKLKPGGCWAVAGAGLVSLKTIIALRQYNIKIDLFVSSKRILSQVLDSYAAGLAAAKLDENRIAIHLNEEITSAEPAAGDQLKLTSNRGRESLVDGLLYAKGVIPINPLAQANAPDNLSRDNQGAEPVNHPEPRSDSSKRQDGIALDSHLEYSANIFAAGDAARVFDLVRGRSERLPLWPLAGEQGHLAGRNMATTRPGSLYDYPGAISCNAFSFFNLDFISAGDRVIPQDNPDWHSDKTIRNDTYCRLNFHKNRLKGFILSSANHNNLNHLRKSGPLLARIRREALDRG